MAKSRMTRITRLKQPLVHRDSNLVRSDKLLFQGTQAQIVPQHFNEEGGECEDMRLVSYDFLKPDAPCNDHRKTKFAGPDLNFTRGRARSTCTECFDEHGAKRRDGKMDGTIDLAIGWRNTL